MNKICELQYNFISDSDHSLVRSEFHTLIRAARKVINPWRIVRSDGVILACSYDHFTSKEQAERNGRS